MLKVTKDDKVEITLEYIHIFLVNVSHSARNLRQNQNQNLNLKLNRKAKKVT